MNALFYFFCGMIAWGATETLLRSWLVRRGFRRAQTRLTYLFTKWDHDVDAIVNRKFAAFEKTASLFEQCAQAAERAEETGKVQTLTLTITPGPAHNIEVN